MKNIWNLQISKHFVNDSIKLLQKNKKLIKNIIEVSIDIYNNKTNSIYYRHSLKGNLKWVSDFEVTWDIRIFILFKDDNIKFLRIGSHSYLWI
jgi:mRNA-degrading endonuclease YafQ of YafQ-DinJ toxin-antitoxin module